MGNGEMADFLQRLRQRKLVQWALAYIAFAFALLQGVDIVVQRFAWPEQIERLLILAITIGSFFLCLGACLISRRAHEVLRTAVVTSR